MSNLRLIEQAKRLYSTDDFSAYTCARGLLHTREYIYGWVSSVFSPNYDYGNIVHRIPRTNAGIPFCISVVCTETGRRVDLKTYVWGGHVRA